MKLIQGDDPFKNLIPSSFELGGTTYKVEQVDNLLEGDNVAFINFPTSTVRIANQFKGSTCSASYKEVSFYHELVHGILDTMGQSELSSDEVFVEGFANLLHQYIKTAK